jgi:arginyl-tRNA synthetase
MGSDGFDGSIKVDIEGEGCIMIDENGARAGDEDADCTLTADAETSVIKKIAEWPRLLELAAKHNEPHRVAFYLYDLASEFHSLWNAGKDDPSLRFLQEDALEATASKLALIRSVQVTLAAGLILLGVTPIDEMR